MAFKQIPRWKYHYSWLVRPTNLMPRMNGKKTHTHTQHCTNSINRHAGISHKNKDAESLDYNSICYITSTRIWGCCCILHIITDRASTIYPVIYVAANPVRGHKEVPRSTGHIMVTTRYSDQQGSKSRQKVMRLCQWREFTSSSSIDVLDVILENCPITIVIYI